MIIKAAANRDEKGKRFRLLNSEIGNDQKNSIGSIRKYNVGFRLLNSEIGNDQLQKS